ncbi:polyamine ABC transporter substrate-binding protein [Devosia sp. J2-20]|jgi:putrescine transport system substrate-binding protein|uniref:Putrescine-binding periplasmic protein n=1 Tax=Devosia litorisediminis TaxID=2829817 RepID=A0A942E9P7_9HYPH|nr:MULTISPECIES: polyamine ABC transporter substrate-binding protein [Devosia]MBS3850166.1 polyamine ABC transporter substrate-binding protein [Devosia litorisediminis]MCZ4347658.1 polyamine ABC transporter substrate-binding protein [Devosia neptuniae]WDQ99936.1 polyamine ABC transporter substrate-binding protein [Devosia sp. J2-20]|tara:strand:+ start:32224 stop:33315 length:1092 start_codon:yes stop_codon:yes gene_type:complete
MNKSLALALGALMVASPALAQEEAVLNVYNWSDYIAEDTIANFEAETGIKVNYDVYDNNEVVEAKLLAGNSGYDIVVPSGFFLERQVQAGLYQELDKSKLTNLGNMDPGVMERTAAHDPDNAHSIDYMWGTTGIGYNVGKVTEALGADQPIDTWDIVFKPELAAKLADCGIAMLDAPNEIFAAALNYLGIDPNSESADDLAKAEELVQGVRPYVRYFHSSQYIDDLGNGEICLAVGYSGDVFIARDAAAEAAQGVEVAYFIPKEGALQWFDLFAIPGDAPHPDNAHKFIDYMMKAEVAAANTNYVFYASGNAAAVEFIDDEIKNDPAIYPPADVAAKLYPRKATSPEFSELMTRSWTRIKTGL